MITVEAVSDYINKIAPYSSCCQWDNCGILIGDSKKKVNKIALALDLTFQTLESAKQFGADLLITHHPIIFKAKKSFVKGDLAYELALSGISAISAHTCFDCAQGGVNDVLCELFDVTECEGIPCEECELPMARIGTVQLTTVAELSSRVAEKLNTVCRVVDAGRSISRVALCGGSGMDFFDKAAELGADCYITGDAGHHDFLYALEKGVNLIAAGHFETENPAMLRLMDILSCQFGDIEFKLINQDNPVKFIG